MLEEGSQKDMISVRYGVPENKPTTVQKKAVSEDRTHDLGIMRPTRYQLRYHRHVLEAAESPQTKQSGFSNRRRSGRVSWAAVQWTIGQRNKETMGQWTIRQWTMGQWTMGQWVNGEGRTGQGDNAHWGNGIWGNLDHNQRLILLGKHHRSPGHWPREAQGRWVGTSGRPECG